MIRIEAPPDERGLVHYVLEITDKVSHSVSFKLLSVDTWSCSGTVMDSTQMAEGYIKWDGCSHVTFGDEGYLHLCGRDFWLDFAKALEWTYTEAVKHIEAYNKSVAE